jgi:hypothetical protein
MSELRTVFKRVDYDLGGLLHYIDIGDIGLPDIQRPFVWSAAKVRDLFDSMYNGFPVGYLLFWANVNISGTRQMGVGKNAHVCPRLLIVDGQQRLTALYAVFRGKPVLNSDYQEKRLEIAFRPRDGTFEVCDAATRKDPEFISDISMLWSSGSSSRKLVNGFLARLGEKRELSEDEEESLSHNLDRLFDLQKFPFTALEVAETVDEEQVANIFVRINSEGVRLNQTDFILTLMSVFWDEGRAKLEHFCRDSRRPAVDRSSSFNHFIEPDPGDLLRVEVALGFRRARLQYAYSILRGKDLETREFSDERRERQFAQLKESQEYTLNLQHWHDFFKALVQAGYRSSTEISSMVGLLYCYALYLIGKRDFGVSEFELRNAMARWFYMSSLTRRYTGSSESTMEEDLARLRGLSGSEEFINALDRVISGVFTEDYWRITLPREMESSAARSPYLFGYYAALNILGARVLFSRMKVSDLMDPSQRAKRRPLERHHLFPKAYLKRKGTENERDMNQIANYALVEWSDNMDISDMSPAEYYPAYADRFEGETLRRMCYWHALPDRWYEMDYSDFLVARRKRMALVIRDAFARLRGCDIRE